MPIKQLLYLSRTDVESINLDIPTIFHLLEEAYRAKGAGQVEMPPKPGIHTSPDAFIHAMPAYIPGLRAAGMKWVSSYPANRDLNLPCVNGLIIVNDVDTGFPIAVMDATWVTAYRTGVKTALSARYLARPESEVMGILACGVQGRANLEALAAFFPIRRVYAYDIDSQIQKKYAEEMSAKLKIEIVGVEDPREAVVDSDLVVTSGPILKNPHPVIEHDWLKPGAFGSAVDFDSYWTGAAISQCDRFFTDDLSQFRYYRTQGYFREIPDPVADLGDLAARLEPGRQSPNERTLAMNLGLAIDDLAIAPEVYRRALEQGLGVWLPF